MKCSKCWNMETRVVDSRVIEDGKTIKRRRHCEYCGKRFTTFERIGITDLVVIKKDGTKEMYDKMKIKKAMMLAFAKLDISVEKVEEIISHLESIRSGMGKEIHSKQIWEDVLDILKDTHPVAYVRFASVYKNFNSVDDFEEIVKKGKKAFKKQKKDR